MFFDLVCLVRCTLAFELPMLSILIYKHDATVNVIGQSLFITQGRPANDEKIHKYNVIFGLFFAFTCHDTLRDQCSTSWERQIIAG